MCVIYVCKDEIPPLEELENGGASNDDGAGVAWLDVIKGSPRIRWKKGLKNALAVHEVVKDLKPPVMIHFRLSTIGGDNPALTHPFPLTERAPVNLEGDTIAVLAHNGHWTKWDDVLKDLCARSGKHLPAGPWSDSRAMAWIVANFGMGMLNITMTDYQKVATFHAVKGFHIINMPAWHDKGGWIQSSATTSRRKSTYDSWPGFSSGECDWRGGVRSTLGGVTGFHDTSRSGGNDGVSFYRPHSHKTLERVIKPIRVEVGSGPKVLAQILKSSPTSEPEPTTVAAEVISATIATQETTKTEEEKKPKQIVILGVDDVSIPEMEYYLNQLMRGKFNVVGNA